MPGETTSSIVESTNGDDDDWEDDDGDEVGAGAGAARSNDDQDDDEAAGSDDDGSQEEGLGGYKPGGYHPVRIGQVYNQRYRVERKLGWGHFSTVWLAVDQQATSGPKHVALKIQKSAKHYTEAALDEIDILRQIRNGKTSYVVQLLDSFYTVGPNGRHMCMVFELLGDNLLTLIKAYDYKGIPILLVRKICRDLLLGLQFLHSSGIIHTDIKPENVLLPYVEKRWMPKRKTRRKAKTARDKLTSQLKSLNPFGDASEATTVAAAPLTKSQKQRIRRKKNKLAAAAVAVNAADSQPVSSPSDAFDEYEKRVLQATEEGSPPTKSASVHDEAKLADLGNACWTFKHFTDDITTRQYRAPETIVNATYSTPVDIWATAALVFELLTGDYLFDPKADDRNRFSRDEDHLALMTELLGPFPKFIFHEGALSKEYFIRRGELRNIRDMEYWPLEEVLVEKYNMPEPEASMIASFIIPMLALDPNRRATALQCLQHPWMQLDGLDLQNLDWGRHGESISPTHTS